MFVNYGLLLYLSEAVNAEYEAVLLKVLDKAVSDPLLSVLLRVVENWVAVAT